VSSSPFSDLAAFTALPRVSGLVLSPDGRRLVTGVARLDAAGARYASGLWEVDPAGERPARQLTGSTQGESSPAFTPSGDLLFTSSRPDAGAPAPEQDAPPALWSLPAGGGEARVVATRPGGVGGVVVARGAGTVLLGSATLPSATDAEDDGRRRAARKDGRVSGVLHTEAAVRFWDHDLGPARTRLLVADPAPLSAAGAARLDLRDLTGHVGSALHDEAGWAITPDGGTVVTTWQVPEPAGSSRSALVALDVAGGERRTLADDPDHEHGSPVVSPDGGRVALLRSQRSTTTDPENPVLAVVDLASGELREVAADWDRWPSALRWTPDGTALVVTADDGGRCPLFRVDVAGGAVTRLTPDDGAYTDPQVSPDGAWVYALRSAVDAPPAPVRVPLAGGAPQPLPGPADALGARVGEDGAALPGTLTEVHATAADGTPLRAWLALPAGAGPQAPAPLVLWIHGGPLGSWNAWSWRWNPWLLVARGYAVLLPDPALSTGYGRDFVRRGWGAWGAAPYTDLLAVTDAAQAREDVDETRTAAMGGSFGGYMANWVAGHTDRFRAIVTHASLWALDQFATTTDAPHYWAREMTGAMMHQNSPHHSAGAVTTPLLVVHGDRDYRVPLGEGLRLWWDLLSRSKAEDGSTPHRFLYFPDENHWVLGPGNAQLWYATVLAFLDHHVLGQEWVPPEALG
jgi:dipeptidyl aminopeptidase/acylaminoacyl peptidase